MGEPAGRGPRATPSNAASQPPMPEEVSDPSGAGDPSNAQGSESELPVSLSGLGPPRALAAGPGRCRLRGAFADPGPDDPPAPGRARRGGAGRDRNRQDGRLRSADPGSARSVEAQSAGPGLDADARVGDPSRGSLPALRPSPGRLPRLADLRRASVPASATPAATGRAGRRRHSRARDGSHAARNAEARRARLSGPRRGRRDAAHGLHRRRRMGAPAVSPRPPDRTLLGHDAPRDTAQSRDSTCATPRRSKPRYARPGRRPSANGSRWLAAPTSWMR